MGWIYEGKRIDSFDDIPEEYQDSFGFVYNITTSEGMEYIGQKRLGTKKKKYVSERYIAKNGKEGLSYTIDKKNNKRRYYVWDIKESTWLNYNGSSNRLNEDIEKGVGITKYILRFCKSKTMLNYWEHKHIICTGAMEEEKFYNDYTQIKVFKRNIKR